MVPPEDDSIADSQRIWESEDANIADSQRIWESEDENPADSQMIWQSDDAITLPMPSDSDTQPITLPMPSDSDTQPPMYEDSQDSPQMPLQKMGSAESYELEAEQQLCRSESEDKDFGNEETVVLDSTEEDGSATPPIAKKRRQGNVYGRKPAGDRNASIDHLKPGPASQPEFSKWAVNRLQGLLCDGDKWMGNIHEKLTSGKDPPFLCLVI